MSEVIKGKLYIGGYPELKKRCVHFIKKLCITDTINVAEEVTYSKSLIKILAENNVNSYHFPMSDTDDNPFIELAPAIIAKLHELISSGACVYLHCHMGVSRSAAIIIGYLAISMGMSIGKAQKFLKSKHYRICSRKKFMKDLKVIIQLQKGKYK